MPRPSNTQITGKMARKIVKKLKGKAAGKAAAQANLQVWQNPDARVLHVAGSATQVTVGCMVAFLYLLLSLRLSRAGRQAEATQVESEMSRRLAVAAIAGK